jgi:excisionase family DNA binding protein
MHKTSLTDDALQGLGRDQLFTCSEAGEHSGTSESYMRYCVRERLIPFHKVGGRYVRIRRSDLEAFIEAGRVEPLRTG